MFWRRKRSVHDFDAEIRSHLQAEAERLQAEGATEAEAWAAARRAFGNIAAAEERFYETGRWIWADHLIRDLRYAIRTLRKSPGFAAVAVATMALAIGANSAIFTVINAVLLRPLPYPEADRLVAVLQVTGSSPEIVTLPDYLDVRDQSTRIEGLAGAWTRVSNLTGIDEPERLPGAAVTSNLFSTLGVEPHIGRTFETSPSDTNVVVLGYSLWQRRFGGAGDIIGRSVALNGRQHTVIGVMPRGFAYPGAVELWTPFVPEAGMTRGYHLLWVVGRLKRGATLQEARTEVTAIGARAAAAYPATNKNWGFEVSSLLDHTVGSARSPLWILAGAVGCVLLIACANIAGLLMSRTAVRRHELSVRTALGAGRGRLVRQLLTESLVLAILGGLAGLAIASWTINPLLSLTSLPRSGEVSLDAAVFLVTLLASVATGLLFGLAPAWTASRLGLHDALTTRGARSTGLLRPALVAFEVAAAVVLLAGAGLLMRSFHKLQQVETGFRAERLVTLRFFLPRASFPVERCIQLYRQMTERAKSLPGVESAAATSAFPFSGVAANVVFDIPGRPPAAPGEALTADFHSVTPGYLRTLGVPLLEGRDVADFDQPGSQFVAVVNRRMADRFFPGQNPIGQYVRLLGPKPRMVVGVVANIRQRALHANPEPEIYIPHTQFPAGGMFLVVRARSGDPAQLAGALRAEVRGLSRDLPIASIRTGEQLLEETLSSRRFSLLLLTIFAAAALVLAVVGVYGVLSFTVSQRTREIGIRMALGAAAPAVVRLVIRQGMAPVIVGLLAGLAAAFAATSVLAKMLFGIPPSDPLTFFGVAILLLSAAFAATLIPARRASRVDPMIALRCD